MKDLFTKLFLLSLATTILQSWTSDINHTGGIYGISETLDPYQRSGGDVVLTISDFNNPSYSIPYIIESPSVNNNCEIFGPGIISITCDDFGTPTAPGDDFAVVEMDPTGTGLGSTYIITSPEVMVSPGFGEYGTVSISQLFGSAVAGDEITLIITDADDPNCSITFTIPNPTPCATAQDCDLTNPGLGIAQCNDNGTPGDPSDDFYTFPLNPVGSGLGSGYTVTASNGILTPPGGNYGAPTTFTLSGVPPGSGVSLIVTDNDDPNCSTNTIINPPPCPVPSCDINFAQVGNITCNDNGTPNNSDDDTFTFTVQVVGTNNSPNGWTTNDPLSTTGQYGVVTTMGPYPISGGGFSLVATDNDDPNCSTISVTIVPPASCSSNPTCNLASSGLFSISCVEAGTPDDPSDDYVGFTLNPTGTDLGVSYSVSISPGTITPLQGNYGVSTSFFTEPGSGSLGDFTVTITDQNDPNCTLTFPLTNPCDGVTNCSINSVDIGFVNCVDNGTPGDPGDDYILFSLSPNGTGVGNTYFVGSPAGPITPNQGTYGVMNFQTFQAPNGTAGAGDLQIIVTDADDPNCTFTLTIPDPGSCSSDLPCDIQDAGLSAVTCNDNGTPNDPSDDFITFFLDPSGVNIGSAYQVSIAIGNLTPFMGTYGIPTQFQTDPGTAGIGNLLVTIADPENLSCSLTFILPDPGTCSDPCFLSPAVQGTTCNDNGTPGDPNDDFFTIDILVTGAGTGWVADDPSATSGNFDELATFGPFPISGGPVIITFTSLDDPDCQATVQVNPPPPCPTICDLQAVASIPICDDAGTATDPGDDLFTVDITINGTGSGWQSDDANNGTGAFGQTVLFGPYPISGGPVAITFTSQDDPTCQQLVIIDPPATCSNLCDLQAVASPPICDDAGTGNDPGDDLFTVDITINGTGSGWQSDDANNGTGAFGQTVLFGPYPISGGPVAITFTSQDDPGCQQVITVTAPATCSEACSIQAVISDVICNDNGTPGISSDDTYTANIEVTGNNTGSGWMAEAPANLSGNYGEIVLVGPFSTNQSEVSFEIMDQENPGCVTNVTIPSTSGCSAGCPTSDSTFFQNTTCNPLDMGTQVVMLTNSAGCDSLVVTTTTLLPSDTTFLEQTSCNPLDTGVVEEVLVNAFGCDSLVVTTTTLLPSDTTFLEQASCNPLDTGVVEEVLENAFGCDSLVVTTTTLLPSDTTFLEQTSCNPLDTGVVEEVLENAFGCDSLVITTTTLLPSDTTFIEQASCNPLDTGVVEEVLENAFGCDSLVITTTALLPSDTTFLEQTSCNPLDTGVVEEVLENAFGCDSLVITTTTLLPSDTTFLELTSCNPLDTGVVEEVLENAFGCDSLVITTTTLLPSDTTFLEQTSCNPLDTGVVEEVLVNAFGCDSLVITTTALLASDTTFLEQTSCNPLDTGVVEEVLENAFGCDSLVITTTTLLASDTTFLDQTSCNPLDTGVVEEVLVNAFGCDSLVITTTTLLASDTTFLDQTSCNPLDTGVVEQVLENAFGCDSLVITTTTLLPSDTTFLEQTSCNPLDTGVVEEVLENAFGCDSLVITTTTQLPSDTTFLTPTVCQGDSILINDEYYSQNNPAGVDVFSSENGCDSLVFISLNFYPGPQERSIDTLLCAGDQLELLGEIFNQNRPAGQVNITGQNGCDSLILEVTVSFSDLSYNILTSDPDCEGLSGSIEIVEVDGGVPPYTYALNGAAANEVDNFPILLGGLSPGEYSLSFSDGIGCSEEAETAFIQPGLTPLVDLGVDIDARLGDSIVLDPIFNFDYDSLVWQPAEILSCIDCPTPGFVPTENAVIQLIAFTEDGCSAEDEILIRVNKQRDAFFPNAFSPNGDGINDYFTVFVNADQVVNVQRLSIFDRWGNQVFLKQGFPPNILSEGWDGTFRGELMNPAVFVYFAQLEFADGEVVLFKGDVVLVR